MDWTFENVLREIIKELEQVLISLGREYSDGKLCFCDMAIGNPMMSSHSKQCINARKVLYGELG